MARLERGLERRTVPKAASAKPVLAPDDAPQVFPSASDDRLPSAIDSLLCERMARNAVHAGMAGKTDLLIGIWHGEYVHVPLPATLGMKKRMSPENEMWTTVLAITGQNKW